MGKCSSIRGEEKGGTMKRVAILTMHRVMNVGSMLQAYALQQAVSNQGFSCEIVDYHYPSVYHVMYSIGVETPLAGRGMLRQILKRFGLFRLAKSARFWLNELRQRQEIMRQSDFLRCTHGRYSRQSIAKTLPRYDIYLTGSDQVWNPRYIHDDLNFFWSFTPEDAIRISYAASFGTKSVPDKYSEMYGRQLRRYRAISVREGSGVSVVKDLAGRDAACVLDPTFLPADEDWSLFSDGALPVEADRPYVFFYLLNYVFDPYPYAYEFARRISRELGIRVVMTFGGGGISVPQCTADIVLLSRFVGPREFIALIRGAKAVVSNSFHGVALSANFHKNFLAILNPNRSNDDRVRDFLARTDLRQRGVELSDLKLMSNPFAGQSDGDFARMEELRAESREWLSVALKT